MRRTVRTRMAALGAVAALALGTAACEVEGMDGDFDDPILEDATTP
jgi:hypothetical protein